ncbi:MAG: sodium-dependent transporter [Bacillota bacterium]|nr:sodium-dependent transporter [Bacillota bacterium]
MSEKKEEWGSTIGYILSALGMAIGTGNVWRFPRQVVGYDGGPFMIAWLVALFVWSIPLLMAEAIIAKKTRLAHTGGFRDFMGKKYAWLGMTCVMILVAITACYSVVVAYCAKYFVNSISGAYAAPITPEAAQAAWDAFRADPVQVLLFNAITMGIAGGVVLLGIQSGIEKVCSVVIPGLFIILVGMTIYLLVKYPGPEGAIAGWSALFEPNFGKLGNSEIWLAAFTQSAWSTGAGWGLLYIYSVSVKENTHVGNNAMAVGVGDQLGALVAATVVVPAIFAVAADPLAIMGSNNFGLTFIWLTTTFSMMDGGTVLSSLFFLVLFGAGVTSMFAMVEVGVHNLTDCGWSRKKAAAAVMIGEFAIGIPSCIWPGFWANQDWATGMGLLFAGLLYAICIMKHGANKVLDEYINDEYSSKIYKIGRWWSVLIRLFPVFFVFLFGWWTIQSIGWYPGEWWNPFLAESTGTFYAWVIVYCLAGFILTKLFMKKYKSGPMTVEE